MSYERKQAWRNVIKQIDPEAERRIGDYISHTLLRESEIPRQYKELILMACSAAVRYGSSTRTHGREAMRHGASGRQVIEALSLASLTAGFTAFIDGIEALGEDLSPPGPPSAP
jgi:alkylhydroperoxidase/carboxymuconolactone decarboxylase family protein YurZ